MKLETGGVYHNCLLILVLTFRMNHGQVPIRHDHFCDPAGKDGLWKMVIPIEISGLDLTMGNEVLERMNA